MLQKLIADLLLRRGQTLCTVESCTGGGIASMCTDLPGCSDWFVGGLVTYSNEMKMKLGVDKNLINRVGAVSKEVVIEMAEKGRVFCKADWSVSVSGIAGPSGGSPNKPVGTVWFAWSNREVTYAECKLLQGSRDEVRQKSCEYSIEKLIEYLK